MPAQDCCPTRTLQWTHSKVGDRFADIWVCTSCNHIHKMESWLAPIRFPGFDGCVNCGGRMIAAAGKPSASGKKSPASAMHCDHCGLSPEKSRDLHDQLAALHPEKSFLQGALAAVEHGRHVLGLKLATAAFRWSDEDPVLSRTIRLQCLEAIGQLDAALDEAYEWSKDAPPVVWGVIADLEGAAGSVEGALKALAYGLKVDGSNVGMWMDYAELLAHADERGLALQAATHGLIASEFRHRALQVIADVGERYYQEGNYFDAVEAVQHAAEHQERNVSLAWLQARVAAQQQDSDASLRWLETVLALDASHAEARAALEKVKPKKKGWFW